MAQTALLGWAGWARGQVIGIRRKAAKGAVDGRKLSRRIPFMVRMSHDLHEAQRRIEALESENAALRDALSRKER